MRLCHLCDICHHLKSINRIFTSCCLSGKHDRIGSVVDRIGNISYLCTCRTRITDHGIKHLCCCDNRCIMFVTLTDDFLLDVRYLACRNFHTEISSGNHDTVRCFNDGINILNTLCILDLRDNTDILSTIIIQKLTDLTDHLCGTDKRCRDEIKFLLDTKDNVLLILLCDSRKIYFYIGNIYTLLLSQLTTV